MSGETEESASQVQQRLRNNQQRHSKHGTTRRHTRLDFVHGGVGIGFGRQVVVCLALLALADLPLVL